MRTQSVLGVVLCFGIMFGLLAGSGVGSAVFGASPGDAEATRTLDDIATDADVDPESESGGLSADVSGDNEPSIVGVAISGGQFVAQLVGAVALLPVTLTRLGFPYYFSVPVGGAAQVIAFIGLAQFVTGRELL